MYLKQGQAEKAADCLKAIDEMHSLPTRTNCLVDLTRSDYHKQVGDVCEAKTFAQRALSIAKTSSLTTELNSATEKLELLSLLSS